MAESIERYQLTLFYIQLLLIVLRYKSLDNELLSLVLQLTGFIFKLDNANEHFKQTTALETKRIVNCSK